jgi:hypothetical protein
MKNISVVLLVALGLVFSGMAEAAKPKKRTRNANRVGAYGMGFIERSKYTGDQSENEQGLVDTLNNQNVPTQNLRSTTKNTDIGYQATFGYRFNRYFSAELGLAQFGEVSSSASADMDFGGGFQPVNLKLSFSAGGPMMSALGYLPINDKFELFGRVGYLFTSSEREITSRIGGQNGGFASSKGDSQDLVLGVGAAFHFNVVYSLRLEYQKIDSLGQSNRTGVEDLNLIGLGLIVRF